MLALYLDGLSSVPGLQSDNSAAKSGESDLYITGRYCLDLWRLVRHEVSLEKAKIFYSSSMHKNKPVILFACKLFFAIHYMFSVVISNG